MLQRIGVRVQAVLEDGSDVAAALTPDTGIILLDIVMKRSDGVQVSLFFFKSLLLRVCVRDCVRIPCLIASARQRCRIES